MNTQNNQAVSNGQTSENTLDKKLEAIGWALFLIMIGGLWFLPKGLLPDSVWLIGTGIILLGLTGVRYIYNVKISGFWVVVGIIALALGISAVYNLNLPVFPALIIFFGLSIIYKLVKNKK